MLSICGRINDERVKQEWNFIALLFLNRAYLFRFLTSRADCDAPCFKQLKATHLRASPKQLALLDVLLQLIKTWPLTIGPCLTLGMYYFLLFPAEKTTLQYHCCSKCLQIWPKMSSVKQQTFVDGSNSAGGNAIVLILGSNLVWRRNWNLVSCYLQTTSYQTCINYYWKVVVLYVMYLWVTLNRRMELWVTFGTFV